jgi:hypothetical protein
MSEWLHTQTVACPYCGAVIELELDGSMGDQRYVEDCSVCCRPIECVLRVAGREYTVEVYRDDD